MGKHTCNKNRIQTENGGDKAWDLCKECMKEAQERRKRNEEAMRR